MDALHTSAAAVIVLGGALVIFAASVAAVLAGLSLAGVGYLTMGATARAVGA